MNLDATTKWLGRWMWKQGDEDDLACKYGMEIYRVKGILWIEDRLTVQWLQGVHTLFEISDTFQTLSDIANSKIVFIGKNLQKSILLQSLEQIVINNQPF